jgi:hypothetical protein
MDQFLASICRIFQQPIHHLNIVMHHGQVQWSEVLAKRLIHKIIVHIEDILGGIRFWLGVPANPVQLIG